MAAHTERMEWFEEAIFKQREEINDRMAEMFGLLKELTASRIPEKVLVREEARHPITKNVNVISLVKIEKEKNTENNEVVDKNVIELSELNALEPEEVVDVKEEVENGTDNEEIRSMKEEITGEGIVELVEIPSRDSRLCIPVDFVIFDVKEDEKCNTPKMGHRGNMSGSVTS
ncbi:hypothetical protein Tco_1521896 [Tanacetum coccineum]